MLNSIAFGLFVHSDMTSSCGNVVLQKGEEICVVGASPRPGYLLVNYHSDAIHVPYQLTELKVETDGSLSRSFYFYFCSQTSSALNIHGLILKVIFLLQADRSKNGNSVNIYSSLLNLHGREQQSFSGYQVDV